MNGPPGARSPRPPIPTPQAGEWTVHGGTAVDVDDLAALSATCRLLAVAADRSAAQVGAACLRAEAALAVAGLASAGGDAGFGGGAPTGLASALLTVPTLPALPARAAVGLAALGLRVLLAADRYVEAESGAAAVAREAGQTIGYVERLVGRKGDPAAGSYQAPDPDTLPELGAGLLAAGYARRSASVGAPADLGAVPPPQGIAGLLALVAGQAGGGSPPPGRVDVATVRSTDAQGRPRTAYVVALPGTTDWSPPGRAADPAHVRNLQANLQLMSGNATAEVTALPEALAAAGVPAGATIVLVGHSQGGMTARAAAADHRVRERYRVGGVITAGSPTGSMAAPPSDVPVLALEHRDDLVPACDGRPNLDSATRTTVTFAGGPAGAAPSPGAAPGTPTTPAVPVTPTALAVAAVRAASAHELGGYVAAAARVDHDPDPRLRTFVGRLREIGALGPPTSNATATLTRVELRLGPA